MGAAVAATFYAIISIISAYFLRVQGEWDALIKRVICTWILLTLPIFFLRDALPIFICAAIILMTFVPKDPSDRIAYFLMIFPAAPEFLNYAIPFPGLNYLMELTYLKVAVLVVLLPILFQKQNSKTSGFYEQNRYYINLLDMLVIAYVVFICAMSLRGLPFTSTLRFFIDCSILILIPYFAISRSLVNTKAIEKVLFAFLILALILSMISIITELKGWKFYFLHKPYVHEFDKDTYRFGFLRVGGIIYNPAVIGMFLTAGLVSLEYFRNTLKIATLHVWLLRFLLIAAIIFSGTRAAILSACIVMVLYIFFSARHAYIRQMIIAAGVICFAAVLLFEQTPSIAKFDAHGTFDYRYQLILASIEQVKAYPFLGQINFIQSGNFDHLLQGQGIIDIVNYYIQIILEYGIVGLTLLLSIFLTAILYIYRFYTQSQIALFPDSFKYVTFGSAFLSLILSYIVYMGTISGVSYLPIFGVVLFAIMRSINHMMYMEWQEHFIKKTLPG